MFCAEKTTKEECAVTASDDHGSERCFWKSRGRAAVYDFIKSEMIPDAGRCSDTQPIDWVLTYDVEEAVAGRFWDDYAIASTDDVAVAYPRKSYRAKFRLARRQGRLKVSVKIVRVSSTLTGLIELGHVVGSPFYITVQCDPSRVLDVDGHCGKITPLFFFFLSSLFKRGR